MSRQSEAIKTIRAARDLIADAHGDVRHADHVVVRALIDRMAKARGLLAPEWPPLPSATDAAVACEAGEMLGELDVDDWDVQDVGTAYEQLMRADLRHAQGSYYTPQVIVDTMMRFSLEQALDELSKDTDPGSVLRVVAIDPACGCGVFLVTAARLIAGRYAERLFGEATDLTTAIVLGEVLSETIFGIDIDPVALDVCRAALWFEVNGEQPITFMDRNLACVDALSGPDAQPAKLAERLGERGQEPAVVAAAPADGRAES